MESGPRASNNAFRRSRGVNWTEVVLFFHYHFSIQGNAVIIGIVLLYTKEETEQLLEAWSQQEVQNLLENGPHNRMVP